MYPKTTSCYVESHCIYSREMPVECLEEIRLRTQVSRPTQYGRFSQNKVKQSVDAAASSSASGCYTRDLGKGWNSTSKGRPVEPYDDLV